MIPSKTVCEPADCCSVLESHYVSTGENLCLCLPNELEMIYTCLTQIRCQCSKLWIWAPTKVQCVLVAVTAAGLISSGARSDAMLSSCRRWPELLFYFHCFSTWLPLPHPASITVSLRSVLGFDEFTVNCTNVVLQHPVDRDGFSEVFWVNLPVK